MKSDNRTSHSRFPAKRRATDPDALLSARKITAPVHLGQPQQQMQQSKSVGQQDAGNFVRDRNVGGFG